MSSYDKENGMGKFWDFMRSGKGFFISLFTFGIGNICCFLFVVRDEKLSRIAHSQIWVADFEGRG